MTTKHMTCLDNRNHLNKKSRNYVVKAIYFKNIKKILEPQWIYARKNKNK